MCIRDSRGEAEFGPVGRAVGRAGMGEFDAGFHQPEVTAVTVPPVLSDAPRQLTQDMRGQMLHSYGGQNQKAAVADDALQLRRSFGIGPAEPFVAGAQSPGGGGDRKSAQAAVAFADDEVTDLRAAQRTIALGMMRPHHRVPLAAGRGAAGHGAKANRPQVGQSTIECWPDLAGPAAYAAAAAARSGPAIAEPEVVCGRPS